MRFPLLIATLAVLGCAAPASSGYRSGGIESGTESSAGFASLEEGDARAEAEEREMLAELAREGIYPEERPCQITVKYHNSGQTIGLYNESYVEKSDYYSQPRRSAAYKVVRNIDMGALLKQLEDFDYFERAQSGVVRRGGVSMSLLVRRGMDAWTVHLPRYAGDPNDERAIAAHRDEMEFAHACADAVRAIYNTTSSLQLVENEQGAGFFEKEAERIREENTRSRGGDGR